jgi:hypothetical protein
MDRLLCNYTSKGVRALRARPGLLDLVDEYMALVSEGTVEQSASRP